MFQEVFKIIDFIDEKTFDILPALSIQGVIAEIKSDESVIPNSVQKNILLSKGRYRFYFRGIHSAIFDFDSQVVLVEGKKINIKSISISGFDEVIITADILENPIPMIAVVAVILSIAITMAALSTSSTLTKVEKVFVTPTATIISIGALIIITNFVFKSFRKK